MRWELNPKYNLLYVNDKLDEDDLKIKVVTLNTLLSRKACLFVIKSIFLHIYRLA